MVLTKLLWVLLGLAHATLFRRGLGPLCSCDCCSVSQGLKCAPLGPSELCSSSCRPPEAVGFLAKNRLLDYSRFCFDDCKPAQGQLSALSSQCLSSKDSDLQQDAHLQNFLEQLKATRKSKALQWSMLRRFPPVSSRRVDAQCNNIGRRFPILVSRNQSILDAYRKYACETAPDFFVTDPNIALTAEYASLENGCVNLRLFSKVLLATNGTHKYDGYRHCSGSCFEDPSWHQLSKTVVNENLLVLSSLRTPLGMEYQHGLLDLFPSAFTMLDMLKMSDVKLVIHSPTHGQLLQSLGVPSTQLLEIPIRSYDEQKLLCVSPGRTLKLWRTGQDGGGELPTLDYSDRRVYADFWWRLLGYRLVPEISETLAAVAGWEEASGFVRPDTVVFLQRCTERRRLANEQEALAAVSSALVGSKRDFELLTFCPGREDFVEQLRKVRRARLIIGEHGGAMANMLVARNGTGVIELVGSPGAQVGLKGDFPPYKSFWYGGAGAAFSFYRVVLYEARDHGLTARVEDLQETVKQWLGTM